jgi:hypothetical protein
MRILEIANAEDQLALLRVIIDNTWTAIAQQVEQQRLTQVKAKPKPKAKPRSSQRTKQAAYPTPAFKPIPLPPAPNSKVLAPLLASPTTAKQPSSATNANPSVAKKTGDSVYKT